MSFDIGQKVICVDDKFDAWILRFYTALPKKDQIYVIRDVRLGIRTDRKTGDVSVTLVGLINPCAESKAAHERGFSESRFRSLDELKSRNKTVQVETVIEPQELMHI